MKPIYRNIFNKARSFEDKIAKEKWRKLAALLEESNFKIKNKTETEILLYIEGEEQSDIELYLNPTVDGYFVHIQLWYFNFYLREFDEEHNQNHHNFKSIYEALKYLNQLLKDIEHDRFVIPVG